MSVRRINHTAVPRDFRLKPENIRASLLEMQAMIASISEQWNTSVYPLLSKLEDKAFSSGLDGKTLFVDADATPEQHGGLLWDATADQPVNIASLFKRITPRLAALDRKYDLLSNTEESSVIAYDDTVLVARLDLYENWIKQGFADAFFSGQAQGTEYLESFFSNTPVSTYSYSLQDQSDNLRGVIGGSIERESSTIAFSGTTHLNAVTTLHAGLVALDAGLQIAETEWEESNGDIYRSNGYVGIGTASPSEKLHIDGAVAKLKITDPGYNGAVTLFTKVGTPHIQLRAHSPDASGGISFRNSGDVEEWAVATNTIFGTGLEFIEGSTVVMYLKHGGNIGIGTTSPTKKLDVAGDINLTGDLSFGGSATVASSIINENDFASASATALASSASIKAYVDTQDSAQTIQIKGDSGATLTIPLTTKIDLRGGLGILSTGSNNEISWATTPAQAHVTSLGTLTSLTVSGSTTLNAVEYTWPDDDGTSGQQLTTDSNGELSWASAGLDEASVPVFATVYINSGAGVDAKEPVQVAGYHNVNGLVGKVCTAPGEAMGIATEDSDATNGSHIKVLIKGVTDANIFPDGNNLIAGTKLTPDTDPTGRLKEAPVSPEVGQVTGWLLEDVSGSQVVIAKIWVQPS